MANLQISKELQQAFETACTSGNTRVVRAHIDGEIITLSSNPTLLSAGGSSTEDFDLLSQEKISPQYYLWNSDCNQSDAWVLIAYVLDSCKVRDKMLYASSHKNLVQTLGASLFKGEFYCNSEPEFAYDGVLDALNSSSVGAPLTEAEEARNAEEKASTGQGVSQAGMSTLPFQLTPAATAAMSELKSSTVNFVELLVTDKEAVDLCAATSLTKASEISTSMDAQNGRFYALRYPIGPEGKLFFILSCPDSTPVRARMVLATVKSTVLEACKGAGLEFMKMMEVQDIEDIEQDLVAEIKSSTEDRSLRNDAGKNKRVVFKSQYIGPYWKTCDHYW